MPLIFRIVKGEPLTFLEGDNNLRYLEGLIISSSADFSNWTGSTSSQFAGTASLALTASYALNAGTTVDTGSLVSTASFNAFTSSYYNDSSSFDQRISSISFDSSSLLTTESFNNFTSSYNTGSFSGSFTGSFEGTASWAQSASYAPNIYSTNGSLTEARTLNLNNNPLDIIGSTTTRFFANGDVGIGTTTSPNYKLDVNGSSRIRGGLRDTVQRSINNWSVHIATFDYIDSNSSVSASERGSCGIESVSSSGVFAFTQNNSTNGPGTAPGAGVIDLTFQGSTNFNQSGTWRIKIMQVVFGGSIAQYCDFILTGFAWRTNSSSWPSRVDILSSNIQMQISTYDNGGRPTIRLFRGFSHIAGARYYAIVSEVVGAGFNAGMAGMFNNPTIELRCFNESTETPKSFINTYTIPLQVGNVYNQNGTLTSNRTLTLSSSYFDVSGATTSRFFSNGNVGIGTTIDGGFKLDVNGTTRLQGALTVSTGGATIIGNTTITGSLNISGSGRFTNGLTVTGSLNAPSITGSLEGTASWAQNALTSSNVEGGTQYYVPVWTGATTLGTSSLYESGSVLKTISESSDVGLKLDFANQQFYLGVDPNGGDAWGLKVERLFSSLGDYGEGDNGTTLKVDASNQLINTSNQGNDIGLKLDFANNYYWLGNLLGGNSTSIFISDAAKGIDISALDSISIGDAQGIFNTTLLTVNDTGSYIKTSYQYNDIGLKLNFSSSKYELGQLTGGNLTQLTIDDPTNTVSISGSTVITGSATITDVLTLPFQDPLPSGKPTGSIALSGSGATYAGMFVYDGTNWVTA